MRKHPFNGNRPRPRADIPKSLTKSWRECRKSESANFALRQLTIMLEEGVRQSRCKRQDARMIVTVGFDRTYVQGIDIREIELRSLTRSNPFLRAAKSFEDRNIGCPKARFCANLLQTCKKINDEATPILYGENYFSAHHTLLGTLPSFMLVRKPNKVMLPPVIHPRVRNLIRKYYIYVRISTLEIKCL